MTGGFDYMNNAGCCCPCGNFCPCCGRPYGYPVYPYYPYPYWYVNGVCGGGQANVTTSFNGTGGIQQINGQSN